MNNTELPALQWRFNAGTSRAKVKCANH